MYEELKYLRAELNQLVSFHSEYANKAINMVIVIWGGVLILFGKDGAKFTEMSLENVPMYFILTTIFFVSNLILYYSARKYYVSTDNMHKLAAYITVFYENLPSETVEIGKNFSWELAAFEIMTRNKNSRYKKNTEYLALGIFSTVLILILLVVLFFHILGVEDEKLKTGCIISFSLCFFCFAGSICLLCKITKCMTSRNDCDMKISHLKDFIQYALDAGYDKEKIKKRLGKDFWNLVCPKG